jgi:hypothetical protein
VWLLLKGLFVRRAQAQATVTLGLGQNAPVTPSIGADPDDLAAPRHESHAIAAYFLAVLAALAVLMWLVPGRGNGLP